MSLFHHDPCIQKKTTTTKRKKKYFRAAILSGGGEAPGAQCRKVFSERSRFLQTEGFAQKELLLLTIKIGQSTAKETKSCPLDPIHSKPVLTPAVPLLHGFVFLLHNVSGERHLFSATPGERSAS